MVFDRDALDLITEELWPRYVNLFYCQKQPTTIYDLAFFNKHKQDIKSRNSLPSSFLTVKTLGDATVWTRFHCSLIYFLSGSKKTLHQPSETTAG